MIRVHVGVFRPAAFAAGALAALVLSTGIAAAQTYGFATMQPGTLNHTTASAIAKVLKEKAGLNVLVQPTAGESVMIPMVARGEAELGIANIFEVSKAQRPPITGPAPDRLAARPARRLLGAQGHDDEDHRRPQGQARRHGLFRHAHASIRWSRAILATGGLTEKDIKPVLVPNVIRGADDFTSGAADMFIFAFGAPKVREVDATVGGIRALEIPDKRHAGGAARSCPTAI